MHFLLPYMVDLFSFVREHCAVLLDVIIFDSSISICRKT